MKTPGRKRDTGATRVRSQRIKTWTRALILGVALVGLGFGGFAALEHLDVAMAAMAGQVPGRPATADGGAPAPLPAKVKIYFFTNPVVKTELRWGKRKLGIINPPVPPRLKKPFFIERPRDSGPMDVLAKSEGFLPLNTRVYTYGDNKVWLKLTAEADKAKVLGYKQEIPPDAGADGGADAGAPPAMLPPPPIGPQLPPPPVAPQTPQP
jgi:hypothetical protein